jgi:hypothetical protein
MEDNLSSAISMLRFHARTADAPHEVRIHRSILLPFLDKVEAALKQPRTQWQPGITPEPPEAKSK